MTEESALRALGGCPFQRFTASTVSTVDRNLVSTFVALSKFVIANDKADEVKQAFRQRPHLVDDQPGFVRMDVLSPIEQPNEIWLVTYWCNAASYAHWHRSHLYSESHQGIPKGLKLVRGATSIRQFEHICS